MGVVLLLGAVVATPVAAQDGPTSRSSANDAGSEAVRPTPSASGFEAELLRRIEALEPRVRAAAERARETKQVRDSIARANAPRVETVEVEVGPLRIVTLPGQEEAARQIFTSELARLGPLAASEANGFGDIRIAFQWAPRLRTFAVEGPSQSVEIRRIWGERAVRRRVRDVLGHQVVLAMPELVRFWLGRHPVRTADEPSTLHRSLILDGSASTRACVQGSVASCWASFGLSGSESPITEWYAPAQVRDLAVSRRMNAWLECTERPDAATAACYDDFLRSGRYWSAAIPFNHAMRADLVAFALELGGPGALDRLLADWPEGVGEAGVGTGRKAAEAGMDLSELGREMQRHLAEAAGVSADELMRQWRERVMAAEPEHRSGLDGARMATGFWILFFAALATRSTRWRLG